MTLARTRRPGGTERPSPRSPVAARAVTAVAVTVAMITSIVGCDGCSPAADPTGPGTPTTSNVQPRKYAFWFAGSVDDLPWNQAVYVTESRNGRTVARTTAAWFAENEPVLIAGRPGAQWVAHAEEDPTPAIRALLWDVSASGTYGDDERLTIELPPRARLRLTGDDRTDPGADTVTVSDEASGARLAAMRDPTRGQRFAVWDRNAGAADDGWRVSQQVAPPRPWVMNDLRPGGTFAIAGRTDGRCWVTLRATMAAGEDVVLDVAGQPAGGATIVCDNPRAELLLHGDFPVPPVRVMNDFYRARWAGVPAGSHALRYPGGKLLPVSVSADDAAERADPVEIALPRDPK